MNISEMTDWQMAEAMGSEATEQDGRKMHELLINANYMSLDDIPEDQWLALIDTTQHPE